MRVPPNHRRPLALLGSTDPSDFASACMSALPSETFADRSDSAESETNGTSRPSRLEYCRMLRFADSAVPATFFIPNSYPGTPRPL